MGNVFILISVLLEAVSAVAYYFTRKKSVYIIINLFSLFLILAAFSFLLYLFLTDNLGYYYVFLHSSKNLELPYKISALWAGGEGSLLLLAVIFKIITFLSVLPKEDLSKEEILIYLLNNTFFAGLIFLFSNPFLKITSNIPADGSGLNPVLKNIWMIIHPPLTFIGYGFSLICFTSSIKRMSKSEYFFDHQLKVPAVFVVLFLGAGIISGAIWSYSTLGWGGFWGWDPVENLSLIPWFIALVYVHSSLIEKRYKQLTVYNNIVLCFIYISVIFSTFAVRSGFLNDISVHSFGRSQLFIPLAAFLGLIILIVFIVSSIYNKEKPLAVQEDFTHISDYSYALIILTSFSALLFAYTVLPVGAALFGMNFSVDQSFFVILAKIFSAAYILSILNCYYGAFRDDKVIIAVCGIISASAFYGFRNLPLFEQVIMFFIAALFLFLLFKFMFNMTPNENKTALFMHIIVLVLFFGFYSLNSHESIRIELEKGESVKHNDSSLTFHGYNEASSNIMFEFMGEKKIVPYYKTEKSEIAFPIVFTSGLSHYYIEPLSLSTGLERDTQFYLEKGGRIEYEKDRFVSLKNFTFKKEKDFASVRADIEFFQKNDFVSSSFVGLKFDKDVKTDLNSLTPFTQRKIKILKFNPDENIVLLMIEPIPGLTGKNDSIVISVRYKKFVRLIYISFIFSILALFILLIKSITDYDYY